MSPTQWVHPRNICVFHPVDTTHTYYISLSVNLCLPPNEYNPRTSASSTQWIHPRCIRTLSRSISIFRDVDTTQEHPRCIMSFQTTCVFLHVDTTQEHPMLYDPWTTSVFRHVDSSQEHPRCITPLWATYVFLHVDTTLVHMHLSNMSHHSLF